MAATLWALALVPPAPADAYIYFGNAQTIGRASNDGTGVDPNFIDVDGFACGVAVTEDHIYWADLDSIGRANIDGTGVEQNFVTFDAFPNVCGLAADSSRIYWANRAANSIGAAGLAGTGVQHSFIPLGSSPCGVAVDADYLYYGWNFPGAMLARAPLGAPVPQPVPGATNSASCAVGVGPDSVYYADYYAAGTSQPIHKATKSGVNYTNFIPGADTPCGIVESAH